MEGYHKKQYYHHSPTSISIIVRESASFFWYSSCTMNSVTYFITFFIVYSGRLVLWVPLKIYRYFRLPLKELYSFSELFLLISLSSSPLMNTIIVD